MSKKQINLLLKSIKESVKMRYSDTRFLSLKNIEIILDCIGFNNLTDANDYSDAHNTSLYQKNSVCYCVLLEVIASMDIKFA